MLLYTRSFSRITTYRKPVIRDETIFFLPEYCLTQRYRNHSPINYRSLSFQFKTFFFLILLCKYFRFFFRVHYIIRPFVAQTGCVRRVSCITHYEFWMKLAISLTFCAHHNNTYLNISSHPPAEIHLQLSSTHVILLSGYIRGKVKGSHNTLHVFYFVLDAEFRQWQSCNVIIADFLGKNSFYNESRFFLRLLRSHSVIVIAYFVYVRCLEHQYLGSIAVETNIYLVFGLFRLLTVQLYLSKIQPFKKPDLNALQTQ